MVMTVDKQQQCRMAQDTCHEMKGNREKNEEQGEKISHFLSRFLQGNYEDALSCIVGSRCVMRACHELLVPLAVAKNQTKCRDITKLGLFEFIHRIF